MVRALVLAVAALLAASGSLAETVAIRTEEEARALAEAALAKVVAGDIAGGFALLKPHWFLPESEFSVLVLQTVKQRGLAEPRFGKSLGTKFVDSQTVADSVLRLTYIEKLEHTALRWVFIFYKPRDTWSVNTVFWDDRIQDLRGGGS